ncbi:RdgB/HAM1 family non-canonical purine NTP pyrophosphatase [Longispora albida]|uniref:RdgB/HAM1 family non-canonical purine NTP pyrophosphatase n=1 Tax=Longispora albida TaxID=203523 RepID=UPI00037B3E78|nr:RdgB/HAM1 family non-canonical purine NTP pyrophosphatase [Longispora albida]
MRILLASRNKKKIVELRRILTTVEIVGLDDVPPFPDTVESGLTFEENALLKARDGARVSGMPCVADDSGLAVDALNGMPGVFSARWSGRHGDDQANLDLLLGQIGDVPDEYRGGAFVCAAALVMPDGTEHVVMGEMRGTIIREARGTGGFGYDPIFVPDGHEVTSAELTPEAKDAISHRGQAFRELAKVIAEL